MMKLKITLAAATIAMFAAPQIANAGNTTMKNSKNGQQVSIQCRNSGCSIQIYAKNGSLKATRTSAGGTANFKKQVSKYRRKGYK